MPKNRAKYLVILKECKNIRHVFVDNLEGKFYNIGSYGRGKDEPPTGGAAPDGSGMRFVL